MKKIIYTFYCALSLFSTTLNAQKWVENTTAAGLLPANYFVTTIVPVTDSVVWLLANDEISSTPMPPKLLRTLNSGATWQVDVTALSGCYVDKMVAYDSLTALILTYNTNPNNTRSVFKTIDGGRTWSEKLKNIKETDIFKFSDKRNGIIIGLANNIVANTADGGDTWTVDSTTQRGFGGQTVSYTGSSSFNKDTICFTTLVDTIGLKVPYFFRSTDKGKTWQRFSPLNTSAWNNAFMVFKDGNNGLMATMVATFQSVIMNSLLKTANGGETWEAVPNLPTLFTSLNFPVLTYIPNTKNSYLIMGFSFNTNIPNIHSRYTIDGGLTWKGVVDISLPRGASISIGGAGAVFSSAKVGWYALTTFINASSSTKIYKWDGSNVLSRSNDIAPTIALTASPNPSGGSVHISWKNAQNTPLSI